MIRKTIIIISIVFAAVFIYANTRFVNPSAKLEPIDVGTFQFNTTTDVDSSEYLSQLKKIKGIHAVSLQFSKKTIGLTYEFQNITLKDLTEAMSLNGKVTVWKKEFPKSDKPSCPVHGAMAFTERLLGTLRIID